MKRLNASISLSLLLSIFSAATCNGQAPVKPNKPTVNDSAKMTAAQQQAANAQAMHTIQELRQVSDQTGFTSLLGGSSAGHIWKDVDAYYKKIDQLGCEAQVKTMLKQQALSMLVITYPFLKEAPTTTKDYYADQLVMQSHPDPKVVIALAENLKPVWAPEKLERFKNTASASLGLSLSRNKEQLAFLNKKLQDESLGADDKQKVRSAQMRSETQFINLEVIKQRLAAL